MGMVSPLLLVWMLPRFISREHKEGRDAGHQPRCVSSVLAAAPACLGGERAGFRA